MNFELTCFIYPLKEKISYSKNLNLYLDNPRTPDEIEFFSNLLIKSYENENNSTKLPIESDEYAITLSELVEIFNETFSSLDEYCKSFSESYNKDNIFEYISRMFVIVRYEDEGEYERIAHDLKEIRKDGTLALTILNDNHPIIRNSENLKHFSSLISLLINTDNNEYFGGHFLLDKSIETIERNGYCDELNNNIIMWGFANNRAKKHFEDNTRLEEWKYGDWRYFPSIRTKLIETTSKLDILFDKGFGDKFIYIARVLYISNEKFDEKFRLLNFVGLIELLVTHNPDFNRYNVEDSISKQFVLKTCVLIHLIEPKEDLEKLKKRLKVIYTQRSNVAHGNFKELEDYEKGLCKKEGKEGYFDSLLTDSLWYLKSILTYCLDDFEFVDFMKKN